ncbi:hypothetical protein B0H12DRAFT_818930 [Mycena haematopus]|nr:hypothetical protein B0H12DRAFT_818930 [Mycena haematopus]
MAFIPTKRSSYSAMPTKSFKASVSAADVIVIDHPTIVANHPAQIADKENWSLNFSIHPVPVQLVGFINKTSPHNSVIKVYLLLPIPHINKLLPKYKFATMTGNLADGIAVKVNAEEDKVNGTLTLSIPRNIIGEKRLLIDLAVNTPLGNFRYPNIDIKLPWI